MSWKCKKCNHQNRDDDAARCANCRENNPARNPYRSDTPEHQYLGRITCPHCNYSNASGKDRTCYKCGKALRK